MSLQYTVRPISDRSQFTGKHIPSQFTVSWSKQLDLLQREYEHLRGQHLVLEIDVEERDIRNDGTLRANARPSTPAVRVAFESKHGPITMATDRFWGWNDNVYAIAKSLEALRMVDRYGVTKRGEQYTGWKAIGSGVTALGARPAMSFAEAVDVVAGFAEVPPLTAAADIAAALRIARAKTHPDRLGDRSAWDHVEQAAHVIQAGA